MTIFGLGKFGLFMCCEKSTSYGEIYKLDHKTRGFERLICNKVSKLVRLISEVTFPKVSQINTVPVISIINKTLGTQVKDV